MCVFYLLSMQTGDMTKSQRKNIGRSQEIISLVRNCFESGMQTTKAKLVAHCINNWGITRRRALEIIDALLVGEVLQEKGGFIYEGIKL